MASYFWVGGTGTWGTVNTQFATSSGGTPGVATPGASDTVTFDGSSGGGTVTVNTNFSIVSLTMGAFTGTLDFSANNNSPTVGTFNGSGTGTRTLNMGSGTWTITGNGTTVWTTQTTTGLTINIGTSTVNFTYAGSTGTRSIIAGAAFNNISISAGSDIVALGSTMTCANLSFSGFTGNWNTTTTLTCTGNIVLGSGMTVTSQAGIIKMTGTSGIQTITSNGVTLNRPLNISGVGGTTQLVDNLSIDNTHILTLTSGTLDAGTNNVNVTCGLFSSSNSNTRTITMGSGTWTLTGTGTVWSTATTTNLTFNPNISTIVITDNSIAANTFSGGGLTYNNLTFARSTSIGNNIITGSNTFATLADTGSVAHSFGFTAGTTTSFTTWNINGQSGNLITLTSTTAATHTLKNLGTTDVVANYLAISYSIAT